MQSVLDKLVHDISTKKPAIISVFGVESQQESQWMLSHLLGALEAHDHKKSIVFDDLLRNPALQEAAAAFWSKRSSVSLVSTDDLSSFTNPKQLKDKGKGKQIALHIGDVLEPFWIKGVEAFFDYENVFTILVVKKGVTSCHQFKRAIGRFDKKGKVLNAVVLVDTEGSLVSRMSRDISMWLWLPDGLKQRLCAYVEGSAILSMF